MCDQVIVMMKKNQILTQEVRLVEMPTFTDPRGDLTFIEGEQHVPFPIRRVYYLYNVPADVERAGHAHKNLEQVLIVMSGSLDICLDDGFNKKKITLDKPNQGLYLPCMIWRDINNFSEGTVLTVIASDFYDENDYYRSYDEFLKNIK